MYRLRSLALAVIAITGGPAAAQPGFTLRICVDLPTPCAAEILAPILRAEHTSGFGSSTLAFDFVPVPEAGQPPLAYAATLDDSPLGTSAAVFGGSYAVNDPADRLDFRMPGNVYLLRQTDLDAMTMNGPAIADFVLAVGLENVQAGTFEANGRFDIVLSGTGTGSLDVVMCVIGDNSVPPLHATAADCAFDSDHVSSDSWSFALTTPGVTPFDETASFVATAGSSWLVYFYVDLEVTNDAGPTEVALEDFRLRMNGSAGAVPLPLGALVAGGLGVLASAWLALRRAR